ncbi:hypothetical protein FPV67DRAFT_1445230 [Lyophyllum atratum]|nr:hypothetical protein FPV67DRAFT_1445230 [Lyophyllum atratum]
MFPFAMEVKRPCEVLRVEDKDLIPLANGKRGELGDEIDPALDFLRDQIGVKYPQLEVSGGKPLVPTFDATGRPSEDDIYGFAVLLLEGDGWKIDDAARKKLLKILVCAIDAISSSLKRHITGNFITRNLLPASIFALDPAPAASVHAAHPSSLSTPSTCEARKVFPCSRPLRLVACTTISAPTGNPVYALYYDLAGDEMGLPNAEDRL